MGMVEENRANGIDVAETTMDEFLDTLLNGDDPNLKELAESYIEKRETAKDAKLLRDLAEKYLARFKK
jgi:hypothetical protein